ncbi:MAG: GldG family protein [Myxococcota bacterium]
MRSSEGSLPKRSAVHTAGLIAGVVGGTACCFAVVLLALEPRLLPLAAGNAVFGVVGVAAYGLTHRGAIGRALRGRSTSLLLLEAVIVFGVLAGVGLVNYGAAKHDVEWDLTRDGLFTLAPQSREVAAGLQKHVTVYGFLGPADPVRRLLTETVRLYRQHTSRLRLELIHPDRAPAELVERFELSSQSPRVVLATQARYTKVKTPTEENLTNALIELQERPARTVAFLDGHMERSSSEKTGEEGFGEAAASLRSEGYAVKVVSMQDGAGPIEGIDLMIIADPQTSLLPGEADHLERFLEAGGGLLALLEPSSVLGSGPHSLGELLRRLGVGLRDDVVVDLDPTRRAVGFDADTLTVRRYEPHAITRPLQGAATLWPRVRSVRPSTGATSVEVLLNSASTSWAEPPASPPPYQKDADDEPGPLPMAVAFEAGTEGRVPGRAEATRMVVIGDADFASNRFLPVGANRDLFVNACNWLLGEAERVTIRPRTRKGDRLAITQQQHYGIMFFSVNLLPLLISGLGFSVWALRRRQ